MAIRTIKTPNAAPCDPARPSTRPARLSVLDRLRQVFANDFYAYPKIKSADQLKDCLNSLKQEHGLFVAAFYGVLYAAGMRNFRDGKAFRLAANFEAEAKRLENKLEKELPAGKKNSEQRIRAIYNELYQLGDFQPDLRMTFFRSFEKLLDRQAPERRGSCLQLAFIDALFFFRFAVPVAFIYQPWLPNSDPHLFLLAESADSGLIEVQNANKKMIIRKYHGQDRDEWHDLFSTLPLLLVEDGAEKLRQQKDQAEALASCDLAMEIWPNSLMIGYKYAWCLFCAGQLDLAEILLKRILQEDENFSYPWNLLSQIYLQKGDYSTVETCCTRAIEIEDRALFFYNRASARYQLGKYEEALQDINRCVGLDESFANARSQRDKILGKIFSQGTT